MRTAYIATVALFAGVITIFAANSAPDAPASVRPADIPTAIKNDAQLRAMTDELARAATLRLNDLDRPYFVQYSVSDAEQLLVNASLGGIIVSNQLHVRQPRTFVRVGNYDFDNTNAVFSGIPNLGLFPIDNNYRVMRTELWLQTDMLYKAATDEIARKRNILHEIADADKTPDLAPAKAVKIVQSVEKIQLPQKDWEGLASRLSQRFLAYPDVVTSNVRLSAIASTFRVANTEGTVLRFPEDLADVQIRTTAVAPDGGRIWNHRLIAVLQPQELPNEENLRAAVDTVARETEELTKAPIADDYSGPVLFEREAAAEMIAQVMTDALQLSRKPLAPPGGTNAPVMLENVWASRVGTKVGPDWLTIIDDPRERWFHGEVLAGQYDVDDEGVVPERLTLVDKGTLKTFLLSRNPVRNYNASNGHGRLPGPFGSEQAEIGNLFIQAEQSLTEAQLKARLLEKVSAGGLKFGLIIRRLDFPSTASREELQSFAQQLRKNGYSRTLSTPILVYRVYPGGREELVRGLRFKEFSAKDLRDMVGASDQPYVLNYVTNGTSFNHVEGANDVALSSVISPSLLFDNVELARAESEASVAPVVPPPALTTQ